MSSDSAAVGPAGERIQVLQKADEGLDLGRDHEEL
jgi:hypothetical protein